MYREAASACDRHLAKHMRDVLGNDPSKMVKVIKIPPHNKDYSQTLHWCSCGKQATFHLVAETEHQNVKPVPTITRAKLREVGRD
jgi:hypothetical protein